MSKPFHLQRRRFLQGLAGFSAAAALGSCAQSFPGGGASVATASNIDTINTDVLRMGYQSAGDLVRLSGVLEKRLEPLGVRVEWLQFKQGPQLMEGMNVGKVDLGSVGNTPPVYAQAAGADIVYVIGRVPSIGQGHAFVVPPNSPIQTLQDIKGQKVVFQLGSATHYFVLQALKEVGLEYSDIEPVSMANVDAVSAFMQGQLPVWVGYNPALAVAKKEGTVGRVIRTSEGLDLPGGYYIGSRKFSEENLGLLKIVNEEMQILGEWADKNRSDVVDKLLPETKLDRDIQEETIADTSYQFEPMNASRIASQQNLIDTFYREGIIPRQLDLQEVLL